MDITKRDKKFLYLGGAIILGMAIYMMVFEPFIAGHKRVREEITRKRNLLKQYRLISANMTEQGDKLNMYKNRYNSLKEKLLSGSKAALAAAGLQKLLQKLTRQLGINIDSIRVSVTKDFEYFVQIPVEITIKCRMRRLNDLMYKIENSTKFLTISRITAKVINMKNPLDIEARLEVSGFIKREG